VTALLLTHNVIAVPVIVNAMGGPALEESLFRSLTIGVAIVALLLSYTTLYRGGRFAKVVQEFEDESDAARRRGSILVLVYVIASAGAFYGVMLATFPDAPRSAECGRWLCR